MHPAIIRIDQNEDPPQRFQRYPAQIHFVPRYVTLFIAELQYNSPLARDGPDNYGNAYMCLAHLPDVIFSSDIRS